MDPERRGRSARRAALFHALLGAAALLGCSRGAEAIAESDTALLSQVKSGLVDRDRVLFAFHLDGRVLEAGREARFSFDYRAPQRMLGRVRSAEGRSLAFDGERLYQLESPLKRLTRTRLELKPAQLAGLLAQLFSPFVPEGFRAPLLPRDRVVAHRVEHPRASQAVELRMRAEDASLGPLEVRYLLRWPSLDFLEKRIDSATRSRVAVVEEHCEPSLKLCVPKALEQRIDDQPGAKTLLDTVLLNQPLSTDAFKLAPPPGFTLVDRSEDGSGVAQ